MSTLIIPGTEDYAVARETTASTSTRINAATIREQLRKNGLKGKELKVEVLKVLRSHNRAFALTIAEFTSRPGVGYTHVEKKVNKRTGAEEMTIKCGSLMTPEDAIQKQHDDLIELARLVTSGKATREQVMKFNEITGGEVALPPEDVEVDAEVEEVDAE